MSKVSKVIYGDTTVIDITDSTVNANNLLSGNKAYGADGEPVFGALTVGSTINVTTSDSSLFGETLTLSKGQTTLTTTFDNSGDATFTSVLLTGTLTLSCAGFSMTISVPSYDTYNVVFTTVPNGKVVTPTDDIQIWLACADIKDKAYTTLAEVLADREIFEILIADSNACDYMARSTSWAGNSAGIVNSLDAMALIGKYDYCSNALLSNATWTEAIAKSDYWDSVLQPLVPTMTSDTTPSGQVIYSTQESTDYAYNAFNNTSRGWTALSTDPWGTAYCGYVFPQPVIVAKWSIKEINNAYNRVYRLEGSNDGVTYTPIKTSSAITTANTWVDVITENTTAYTYYKCVMVSGDNAPNYGSGKKFQFYGHTSIASQAIQLNPNMTSATTPYGEVITDATPLSNTQPYYAFDGTILDMFKAELANKYLGYIFDVPTVVKRFTINSNQATVGQRWYKAKLQVSVDGTTWTDFDTYTNTQHANVFTVDIDNSTEYLGYRFYFLDDEITGACFINIIAFYGAPINTVIHSAKSDTIYTYIDGVQTTLTTTNYSKGIGYCDFSKLEAGTYTLYSTIAKNPSNLSQPYTKEIVITKTPHGNTTEVYFMPNTVKTLYWYGYENEMEDCMPVNGWSYSSYTLTSPTHNTNDVYVISQSSGISAYATKKPITSSSVKFVVECGSGGRLLFSSDKVASNGFEPIGTVYSTKTLITRQDISSKYAGVEGFFGVANNSVRLYALWYE